jgi:hypothetical protein
MARKRSPIFFGSQQQGNCHIEIVQFSKFIIQSVKTAQRANFDLCFLGERKKKKFEGFYTSSWVSRQYPFWVFFGDNCSYFLALYPGFGLN